MEKWLANGPWVLFCLYFIKLGAMGTSYADAVTLLFMGAVVLCAQFFAQRKKKLEVEVKITSLEDDLKATRKDLESVRGFITSQKMGQIRLNQNAR